jgi:antitoxin ParD1/3/4
MKQVTIVWRRRHEIADQRGRLVLSTPGDAPMSVTLSSDVESLIREQIDSGRYSDASEVVREGLRLIEARDRLQRLRAALAEGETGESIPFTPELVAQMKRDAAQMAREGRQPNPDVCP